jgi:hypothetical protein
MHKILQNFHASVCGRFGRFGSSHFLSENFMTSVIKLGLKMVIMPNVNRPTMCMYVIFYENMLQVCRLECILTLLATMILWCISKSGFILWDFLLNTGICFAFHSHASSIFQKSSGNGDVMRINKPRFCIPFAPCFYSSYAAIINRYLNII